MVTAEELAATLGTSAKAVRARLRRMFPDHEPGSRWVFTKGEVVDLVEQFVQGASFSAAPEGSRSGDLPWGDRDQDYVLDICDEVLGEASDRECTFDWLRGDPNQAGKRAKLRVDGHYPNNQIVVEYWKKQHAEPVQHFDKPGQLTISGVPRAEQRRRYDQLRQTLIPANGLRLVIIKVGDLAAHKNGKLRRQRDHDRPIIATILSG